MSCAYCGRTEDDVDLVDIGLEARICVTCVEAARAALTREGVVLDRVRRRRARAARWQERQFLLLRVAMSGRSWKIARATHSLVAHLRRKNVAFRLRALSGEGDARPPEVRSLLRVPGSWPCPDD